MREIVLDTETTGLDHAGDDRIVEIACIELDNHVPTGVTYQTYVNPERDVPEDAFRIHGLSAEFLAEHPVFTEVASDFLTFIGEDPLVIHNAEFDLAFLNSELRRMGRDLLAPGRAVDTLALARRKFPGTAVSLDALCKRFRIDNSERTKHGALLDSELLAEVYLELIGGRQPDLTLTVDTGPGIAETAREPRAPRPHGPSPDELERHSEFMKELRDPIWNR